MANRRRISDEPINLQWIWRQFDVLYKMFEEEGYINYNLDTKESNTEASEGNEHNLVISSKINKRNIYPYCTRIDDICDDIAFRNNLFKDQRPMDINEVTKQMIVLDSGATNGMCPYEDLCTNVIIEKNEMICGGGNEMNSNKIGDLIIMGKNREMKTKIVRITDIFIDPKSH